jgi:gamma-glutamyl hydrolase
MIGIIALPKKDSLHDHVYPTNYVVWIEHFSKSKVIPYNVSYASLMKTLPTLTGMIFIGGGIEQKSYTNVQRNTYIKTLFDAYTWIKHCNDHGRYFPLWGSCLGFEMMLAFENHVPLRSMFHSMASHVQNINSTITFTNVRNSRLKNWFPLKLRKQMELQLCAVHHHQFGFDIQRQKKIIIVSIERDYVNMVEFCDYPFYGVQFHPERPFDDFSTMISLELSRFFSNECSKK